MKRVLGLILAASVSSAAGAATDPRTLPTKLEPAWQTKTRDVFKQAIEIPSVHNRGETPKVAKLLAETGQNERLLIATDTPTGSGVMPLGMLYTMSHLVSLGGVAPEIAIAMATGNNARVYRLNRPSEPRHIGEFISIV